MRPIQCNYYVTLRCNSRCEFCNIWKDKRNFHLKEQSIEDVKNNLRDLKKLGVKFMDFTGGEPLLYSPIVDAFREAKKLGFYTALTTNCLLYPKYAAELRGLVDILQFSLDSANEKEHNAIRGVASYQKVIESIKIAKELKEKPSIIHTVTNQNIGDLPQLIRFAHENKILLVLNPCFGYFGNEGISKGTAKTLRKYFDEKYVAFDLANLELILDGGNNINRPICKAVSSSVVISPDNYLLLPCYHHAFKKIRIKNNLFETYNSDEVQKLMKFEGRFDFCRNCTVYCYMRVSFYRNVFGKYFLPYIKSGCKYIRERFRS